MTVNQVKSALLLGLVLLLTAGCVQEPLKVKPIAKTENPASLARDLGQALAEAKAERVDILAPTWFAQAQASHDKARIGLDQGTALAGILENLATGDAQLKQARKFADRSRSDLAKVIESRDAAMKADAGRYAKPFAKLENDFLKLTRAVENKNTKYVNSHKKEVNDSYRALELTAIKDATLAQVREMLRKAEDDDLDEAAPKSYLVAKSKLADADAAITRDRYDKKTIDAEVATARFFIQRMQEIAKAALRLEKMEPEAIALWMESYMSKINTGLKGDDLRDLSFDQQQAAISDAIAMLSRNRSSVSSLVETKNLEIEKLNRRIAELEGRTYQERADKERLAAEKRFNELYNQVQRYFSPDQAEVYKKAQQLVIRLKAMQFPVGQAVIVPENYPLLATVQKAIRTFGRPAVVIEGHTDSTGTPTANQILSQSRAESVRKYLIANDTLPASKIDAQGYGATRPLAPNTTAAGRAVNRRIDVIIKPSMASMQ